MSSSEQQVLPSKSILKQLVAQAGADWCGVQEDVTPRLLMFNSRKTGSTLAIKFNPFGINEAQVVAAIRTRVAESDKQFEESENES